MGANDANGKIYISAEVIDNFKQLASEVKNGLSQVAKEAKLEIEIDDKDTKTALEKTIKGINGYLSKTKFKKIDYSKILTPFNDYLEDVNITSNDKLEAAYSLEETLSYIDKYGSKIHQKLIESLDADGVQKYFKQLNSIMSYLENNFASNYEQLFNTIATEKGFDYNALFNLDSLVKGEYGYLVEDFLGTPKDLIKSLEKEFKKYSSDGLSNSEYVASLKNVAGYKSALEAMTGDFLEDIIKDKKLVEDIELELDPTSIKMTYGKDAADSVKKMATDVTNMIFDSLDNLAEIQTGKKTFDISSILDVDNFNNLGLDKFFKRIIKQQKSFSAKDIINETIKGEGSVDSTKEDNSYIYNNETEAAEKLRLKIEEVQTAINNKTLALEEEADKMSEVVASEMREIDKLNKKIKNKSVNDYINTPLQTDEKGELYTVYRLIANAPNAKNSNKAMYGGTSFGNTNREMSQGGTGGNNGKVYKYNFKANNPLVLDAHGRSYSNLPLDMIGDYEGSTEHLLNVKKKQIRKLKEELSDINDNIGIDLRLENGDIIDNTYGEVLQSTEDIKNYLEETLKSVINDEREKEAIISNAVKEIKEIQKEAKEKQKDLQAIIDNDTMPHWKDFTNSMGTPIKLDENGKGDSLDNDMLSRWLQQQDYYDAIILQNVKDIPIDGGNWAEGVNIILKDAVNQMANISLAEASGSDAYLKTVEEEVTSVYSKVEEKIDSIISKLDGIKFPVNLIPEVMVDKGSLSDEVEEILEPEMTKINNDTNTLEESDKNSGFLDKYLSKFLEHIEENIDTYYLEDIVKAWAEHDDDIKVDGAKSFGIYSSKFLESNGGHQNKGIYQDEEITAIIRDAKYEGKIKALIPVLNEAYNKGANVARILAYVADEKELLEIQETASGHLVGGNDDDLAWLEATDEQLLKLISDFKILQETGLYFDIGGENLLYDKDKGFSLIDLAIPKDKNNIPYYNTNDYWDLMDYFKKYGGYHSAFTKFADKLNDNQNLFEEKTFKEDEGITKPISEVVDNKIDEVLQSKKELLQKAVNLIESESVPVDDDGFFEGESLGELMVEFDTAINNIVNGFKIPDHLLNFYQEMAQKIIDASSDLDDFYLEEIEIEDSDEDFDEEWLEIEDDIETVATTIDNKVDEVLEEKKNKILKAISILKSGDYFSDDDGYIENAGYEESLLENFEEISEDMAQGFDIPGFKLDYITHLADCVIKAGEEFNKMLPDDEEDEYIEEEAIDAAFDTSEELNKMATAVDNEINEVLKAKKEKIQEATKIINSLSEDEYKKGGGVGLTLDSLKSWFTPDGIENIDFSDEENIGEFVEVAEEIIAKYGESWEESLNDLSELEKTVPGITDFAKALHSKVLTSDEIDGVLSGGSKGKDPWAKKIPSWVKKTPSHSESYKSVDKELSEIAEETLEDIDDISEVKEKTSNIKEKLTTKIEEAKEETEEGLSFDKAFKYGIITEKEYDALTKYHKDNPDDHDIHKLSDLMNSYEESKTLEEEKEYKSIESSISSATEKKKDFAEANKEVAEVTSSTLEQLETEEITFMNLGDNAHFAAEKKEEFAQAESLINDATDKASVMLDDEDDIFINIAHSISNATEALNNYSSAHDNVNQLGNINVDLLDVNNIKNSNKRNAKNSNIKSPYSSLEEIPDEDIIKNYENIGGSYIKTIDRNLKGTIDNLDAPSFENYLEEGYQNYRQSFIKIFESMSEDDLISEYGNITGQNLSESISLGLTKGIESIDLDSAADVLLSELKEYSDSIVLAEKQFLKISESKSFYTNADISTLDLKKYTDKKIDPKGRIEQVKKLSEELATIKEKLNKEFDSEGKISGEIDQNRIKYIQELINKYKTLTSEIKQLKDTIKSSDSIENIQLDLKKQAEAVQKLSQSGKYGKFSGQTQNLIDKYTYRDTEGNIVGQNAAQIKELQTELVNYNSIIEKIKTAKTDQEFVKLGEEAKEAQNKIKELTEDLKEMSSPVATKNQTISLAKQISSFMTKNSRISVEARSELQQYFNTLTKGASVGSDALEKISLRFKEINIAEQQAGRLGGDIFTQMVGKMREGIAFLTTKVSAYEIFNQFRQGFEIIHQFDDALTEMMKVSDETRLSLERYQKTTFETADAIGTSALQIQNSTADFMRLGETLTEAAESAKTANVLMNVSEFQSIDDATTSLIAMSAAYDDLSKMNIIDKLNEVGNNFSISTSGAAEALQASASALKVAGNNMDEALALVTAGNQIVQDVSKAGNGLRTIALRLTGTKNAKEELEEMGEETDTLITSQSKLRDTIKQATAVASNEFKGFDILDNNGNYKSTYEIMLGISQIYQEILDTDKQLGRNNANLLLETVAGKTRANIAASIFQSPDILKEAYQTSQEANGSAMRENDKFIQSISGHLAQLTNAWQEMWANAMNRDVINFFIDAAKTLVNFANVVGIIPSTLVLGLPFFEMISRAKTGKGAVTGFFEWASKLPEAKKALEETAKAQANLNTVQEASVAIDNAKTASNEAKTASTVQAAEAQTVESTTDITGVDSSISKTAANEAETLSVKEQKAAYDQLGESEGLEQATEKGKGFFTTMRLGVKGLISTIGAVPLAIAGIVAVLAIVKNRVDALRESWFSDAKDITNKINEQQESMAQQIESYNTLKKQLDSGDLSEQETLDTKQKIFDIQKSISDQYGSQAQGLDLVNGKLETQIDLLNSITQKNAEEQYGRGLSGFRVAREEYEKNNRNYNIKLNGSTNSSLNKAISEAYNKAGLRMVNAGMGTFNANVSGTAIDSIETLQRARKELENLKKEYRDPKMLEHLDDQIYNIEEQISEAYEIVEKYEETALKGMELDLAVNNRNGYDIFTNYQSSVSNLEDAYVSGDTKKINEARLAYIEATKEKEKFLNDDFYNRNGEFDALFKSIDTSIIEKKNQYADVAELLSDIATPNESRSLLKQEENKNNLYKDNSKALRKYTDSEKKVRKEAERLYKLNPDRIDIEGTLLDNTYASGKYANALNNLQNALGWSADDAQGLVDILIDAGIVQGSAADMADYSANSYNNFSSSVEEAINALSVLNTVMSESYSGQGITDQTLEQFKQTFGEGAYQALEKTANGYHINAQEAYSLRKQQEALVDTDYSSALSQQYNALNKLNEGYRKAIYNNEDTSAFAEQRKAIENNITKLQDRMMAFNNANSAYQTWIANQSNNGERQMYESIYGGFDTIKDEFEHGWAGVKTRSWMDLILGDESEADFDVWDAQATELKKRYDQLSKDIKGTGGYSIKDFFTADNNGKITSKGVMNFFKAIENKQDEVGEKFVDLEEGWFDFTNGGDQRIANLFGIDIEAVDAILRAAAEAGAEVKLDQPIFSAERLEEEAIKAKTSLEKDLGGELNINLNPDSIEEANLDMAKLTEYRDKLASDTSLEPTVKTKRLEELSDIMAYISTKEREIVENSIIDFEVKNTDLIKADKEINSIFSGLEHYSDRFGKRTDGINKILSVDPSTLNDLTSLKDFYGTVREAKLTPEVNDEQVAMLDALLKAIEDKINAINNKPVEGQSLSFSQYEQGLKTITQINDTIKKAKESGADFEFNWEGDEEFMSLVEFIDGLDAKQKMQLGLDPDINAQQILEIARNGGTIELGVESNTTPAQLTTPQPQTKQELQQVITTELKAHDVATPTIENASKSAGYFGKTYTAELKAKDNASKEIEKPQKKADEFGKTKKEAQIDVKGADTSNAKIDNVKTNLLSMPNKVSSSIHIDVSGANKITNALDDLSKLRNAARNNIHLNLTQANGTAHAQGTAFSKGSIVSGNAFAGGKWGISKNQTALTGELGTEIVVRDGNWFTVGEDGAEFVNLQKGDIVFNHKQAQELLENGYVTSNKGRGHLVGFANGSAFASGSAYDGGSTGSTLGMLNSTADKKTTSKTTSSNKDTSKGKTTPKTTDKEANKTKNTLDEVEILIARIERQIANLDKTISSTYKTWSTRNIAIKNDLTKVAQEIKDQNNAYTTYIKKANSVGLPAAWKKKVQSGKFKIEDVTNDKLWQQIQDYKTYYEKALAAKDAVIDLKEKEGELYKQRFDNEQTYYEERVADIQHYIDLLETYNDTLSESGKLGSEVIIQDQISRENIRLKELNKEYNSLIARRDEAVKSGKIKKYSEAWYEMEEAIHEVNESIAEANNNLITYANNIRQLDWDRWDKVHDAIGGVNNELEFLYDLFNADDFFDDQGNLTDQGVTAFALLAQQYDIYFREAQEYQKEIEATEELLKANDGENQYDQNLVDKLKELKEAQQDAISSAKKMKESMVDLTEDGIKKQIDYVKDLIEDYEELLEAQKDQTDYAKKVADQQKEINKLEKQYRAIQNDTSEEGATKRQKLRDQINEKKQDLKDTQEDRRISETKDMLSDFQESFEEFLNNKLKDIEGIVQEVINRTNANGSIINDTITTLANSYGYTPSDTLKNTLTDLSNNLVSYFNSVFDNENVRTIASGVDEIVKYYKEAQAESEKEGQASANEAMAKQVKETGTHIQNYTDSNGDIKAGFFEDNGAQNTSYNGFAQKDGKQYLFTNGSIEKTNQWYTSKDGKKYYLDQYGATKTGWQTINGKKYYLDPKQKGAALTGWQTIDKKRYYFDANGKMYKGLKTIGNKKYYFDPNGVLLKGTWRKISNKQYYLDKKDGHVLTGKQTIDGKKYTFNADGTLKKSGWKKGTASVPKTGMAWTNEGYKAEAIIRKSDGAILTPLNKGDSVIPSNAMKNMYQALTDPEKYLKQYTTPDVRIVQGNGSTNNQSPTINMQFIANGVQDANKFVNELMNNKKLEKWIQEVTLGQANGHNSFRKYSYAIR